MKKFACPVSMKVNKEQHDYLIKELEKLGYILRFPSIDPNYLVTNYGSTFHHFTSYHCNIFLRDYRRYFIDHYNPELFLALAAMVEGEELHKGEWCYCTKSSRWSNFTIGKVYKAVKDNWRDPFLFLDNKDIENGWSGANKEYFRKATKEEIINRFTKKESKQDNKQKEEKMKIYKLYKLKDDKYKKAVGSIVGLGEFAEFTTFIECSFAHDTLEKAGVMHWFEEVNDSPITYLGLIPFEYYNELTKRAFENYKKNGVDIEEVNDSVEISGYKGNFNSDNVLFGCVTILKSELKQIKECMSILCKFQNNSKRFISIDSQFKLNIDNKDYSKEFNQILKHFNL